MGRKNHTPRPQRRKRHNVVTHLKDTGARCPTGKVFHDSDLTASRALVRAKAKAAGYGYEPPLRYYKCDKCPGWHLTKKPLLKEGNGNYFPMDSTTHPMAAE
jgi:hypothetical protein